MAIPEHERASFHLQSAGHSCLKVEGHCLELGAGDFVVLPHGHAHTFADSPNTHARPITELPLDTPDGEGTGERSVLVCGGARMVGPASLAIQAQLPPFILLRRAECESLYWLQPTLAALDLEAQHRRIGSDTVMARLADVLLIHAIRAWIDTSPERSPWFHALKDPQIGRSLALMHTTPEKPWDLQSLAKGIGMGRATFAERFAHLVGLPPMTYLTRLRMRLAASALKEEPVTLGQMAERLGYGSEAAFSRAYKKHFGMAPGTHRRV